MKQKHVSRVKWLGATDLIVNRCVVSVHEDDRDMLAIGFHEGLRVVYSMHDAEKLVLAIADVARIDLRALADQHE